MKESGSPQAVAARLREIVPDQVLRARLLNIIDRVREYEQKKADRPKKVTFTVTHKRNEQEKIQF